MHLQGCASCRAELQDYERLDEVLHGFADPPVVEAQLETLWSRVEAQLPAAESTDGDQEIGPALLGGSTVLLPRPASAQPRWLVPTFLIGGVAACAVVVLALALVLREGRKPLRRGRAGPHTRVARSDQTGQMEASMGPMAGSMATQADAMDVELDMGATRAATMASVMAATDQAKGAKSRVMGRSLRRRRGSAGGMSSGATRSSSSASSPRRVAPRTSHSGASGGGSLQDLLRRSTGASSGGSSAAKVDPSVPSRLSPGQIRSGMGRVFGAARGCYTRYHAAGTCRVRVTIRGTSGRVSSVQVLGAFAGTPTGRCVERAVKRARFARFRAASQSFVFPLVFR